MAFSAITARGSVTAQTGATTIAMSPSANLTVGKLVIVTVHTDNIGTADGTSTDHSSVADNASGSQNVWRKATEKTDTDGVAADGAVVSVWYSVLKTQIATTDTITCTLAGSITARAITCTEATITDNAVEVEDVGTGQGSITAASAVVNSREYLFFYAASSEGNDNSKTQTTNYVEQHDFRTGNTGDVNISGYVQARVQTATSSGSVAPSAWATNLTNPISVLVSFRESRTLEMPAGSAGVTGLAGALALGLAVSVGSIGLTGLEPALAIQAGTTIEIPAGSVGITSPYIGVAFEGPTVGSIDLTGLAPTVSVSAGGTELSPGAGSIDLTGQAPALGLGVGIPAGSIDLVGLAPALSFTTAIPVGSIDLTGLAPSALPALAIAPGAGSIDLAGLAPALGMGVGVPVGSIDLAGLAPALSLATAIPSGSLDLAGLAPVVNVGNLVTPGVGSIDITGQAPALDFGVGLAVGSVDLTGLAPSLLAAATRDPGVGSIDLTGLAPALAFTTAIPVGSIDLTGGTPALSFGVAVGAGSIDLTGLAPAVVIEAPGETNIPIGVGSIDLTGTAGALLFGMPVPAGTVDLTGLAPTVSAGNIVSTQVGSLDLTGLEPALVFATVGQPQVGTIDLTGQAPALAFTIAIPVGSLGLTGLAPTISSGDLTIAVIDVTGTYEPTAALTGTYEPTLALTGTYSPSIAVTGVPDVATEATLEGLFVGEDKVVEYRDASDPLVDMTGWTVVLDIRSRDTSGTAKLSSTGVLSGTYNVSAGSNTQKFTFSLSDDDLASTVFTGNDWSGRYSIKRTNAGAEQILRYGDVTISRVTQA